MTEQTTRIGIVTVSDRASRGEYEDRGGPAILQYLQDVLRSEWQTPILLDGYLYGMDNVGGAGPVTHLTCVHAATGERQWQQTRFGKGNFIAAEGAALAR